MNTNIRNLVTFATVFSFYLFCTGQMALGQNVCLPVKGKLISTVNGGITSGTVTNSGLLNGTEAGMFTAGPAGTADPATISFTRSETITTNSGELKLSVVGIFMPAAGLMTELWRIDPTTSTGKFAGATGNIYFNGQFDGAANFEFTGEVCLQRVR